MSRRRRLALRQVAEPETAVVLSDVEDDMALVTEPNFSLLGMVQQGAPEPARPAIAPTAAMPATHELPASTVQDDGLGDHDMDGVPTQLITSASHVGREDAPVKKARVDAARAVATASRGGDTLPTTTTTTDTSSSIFHLYQTGLSEDHTLRLHYIRRRPPPPPQRSVEDEFVLPRPSLSLRDLLPKQLVSVSDIMDPQDPAFKPEPIQDTFGPVDELVKTAKSSWRQLATAPEDLLVTWRGLQESDWIEVHEASGSHLPAVDELIRLLKTLRSDAFASFAWRELLGPVALVLHRDKIPQSKLSEFAAALLDHDYFRQLPGKEFRLQLRAKNLRGVMDQEVAAAVEMELVTQFYNIRNQGPLNL